VESSVLQPYTTMETQFQPGACAVPTTLVEIAVSCR